MGVSLVCMVYYASGGHRNDLWTVGIRDDWGCISDVSFSIRSRSLLASERLTHSERETKSAYLRGLRKVKSFYALVSPDRISFLLAPKRQRWGKREKKGKPAKNLKLLLCNKTPYATSEGERTSESTDSVLQSQEFNSDIPKAVAPSLCHIRHS